MPIRDYSCLKWKRDDAHCEKELYQYMFNYLKCSDIELFILPPYFDRSVFTDAPQNGIIIQNMIYDLSDKYEIRNYCIIDSDDKEYKGYEVEERLILTSIHRPNYHEKERINIGLTDEIVELAINLLKDENNITVRKMTYEK